VVVRDLNIERIAVGKSKANAPLIIDPYRALAGPVTLQRLKAIGWRQTQVLDVARGVQLLQAHGRSPLNVARQASTFASGEKPLGFSIGERSDHLPLI
jgi:hypothetical protein